MKKSFKNMVSRTKRWPGGVSSTQSEIYFFLWNLKNIKINETLWNEIWNDSISFLIHTSRKYGGRNEMNSKFNFGKFEKIASVLFITSRITDMSKKNIW